MRIQTQAPIQFATGQLLDPNKVQENQQYMLDAVAAVTEKRYAHSVISMPFYRGITACTQADNQATRSFLFTAPDNVMVERAFLVGALASGAAVLNVYNASTGTTAPTGIANPILTPTTTVDTQVFAQSFIIPAGSTYRFELTGTTFTASKLDLVLHLRTDRFNLSGTDTLTEPTVTPFTEATSLDAVAFNANVTAITSAVSSNTAAARALRCQFVQLGTNFTNASDADLLRMNLPRITNTIARETIYRIDVTFCTAANSTITVTAAVLTEAGAATGLSAAASTAASTEASASDTFPAVDLSSATAGVCQTTASDYRLTVSNGSATAVVKAYVTLWTY